MIRDTGLSRDMYVEIGEGTFCGVEYSDVGNDQSVEITFFYRGKKVGKSVNILSARYYVAGKV